MLDVRKVNVEPYLVCMYCFKPIEPGERCSCALSKGKPSAYVYRYDEFSNEGSSYQAHIGVQVILSPGVKLCRQCRRKFEAACRLLAEIVDGCNHDEDDI